MNASPFLFSLAFALLLLSAVACGSDAETNNGFQATPTIGPISNADLIRNPVQSNGAVDSFNVAKMAFAAPVFTFDTVDAGAVIAHEFSFTNTGRVPLLITDARATCGCTVPEWPQQPIAPGSDGVIKVVFNTENKKGKQSKPITITANTYPATNEVRLVGVVRP